MCTINVIHLVVVVPKHSFKIGFLWQIFKMNLRDFEMRLGLVDQKVHFYIVYIMLHRHSRRPSTMSTALKRTYFS